MGAIIISCLVVEVICLAIAIVGFAIAGEWP
jgi:hypothetical protein